MVYLVVKKIAFLSWLRHFSEMHLTGTENYSPDMQKVSFSTFELMLDAIAIIEMTVQAGRY